MDALHLDARLAAATPWGRTSTHAKRCANSPVHSPDPLATVRMAACASPPPSARSLSSERGRSQETIRSHLDARTWMPSRERQELAVAERTVLKTTDTIDVTTLSASMLAALHTDLSIQRKMHEKLTSEFVASQKEYQQKAAEWSPPRGFHRCMEELVEPLWKAYNEVLSQCTSYRTQHEELRAQAITFSSEQEAHSAAIRDLREISSQVKSSLARPIAATQHLGHNSEPWRKELEVLRNEQRSALADQVHLLQKEFEAAYRAEQLAGVALNRVTKLERGLAEMSDSQNVEDLACRVKSLESDRSVVGTRSAELSLDVQFDNETASQVHRNLDDLAAAVSCQADKICQVERELLASRATQSGQLAEALAQSQQISCGLEEERTACQMGLADLKSDLQQTIVGADELEKKCMDAIAQRCDLWAHELASRQEDLTRTATSTKAIHEECKRLGRSYEVLGNQVEGMHQQMYECNAEMVQRCGAEAEARVSADLQLHSELTNAMTVIKAQFEEWMEMVRILKSEVADLTKLAKVDQEDRTREAVHRQTEFASLVELARGMFEDAARLSLWNEGVREPLDSRQLQMAALSTSFDKTRSSDKTAADVNTVCKLVIDILGIVNQLSKRCLSESGKCRNDIHTVAELSESLQQEHRDTCKSLQKEVSELRLQLAKIPMVEFDGAKQISMVRKEVDVAVAAFHAREEGRAMEFADNLSNLSNRVLHIERSLPHQSLQEPSGHKTRARQTILHAMEAIEAAAQRVAIEASIQDSSVVEKAPDA